MKAILHGPTTRLLAILWLSLTLVGLFADLPRAAVPANLVETINLAQAAYAEGRSEDAVGLYRQVLLSGWTSSDLFYNLGCACFKAGQIGWAVAYLEEARRLSPRDGDIRHNLKIAAASGRDRVTREEPSRFLGMLTGLLDSFSPADLIRLLIICIWSGAGFLTLYWLTRGPWRRIARGALVFVFILLVINASGFALKFYQIKSAPGGVIVAPEVQVLSGPRDGETVQFVLHAGTLLHLGRDAGAWREVWLSGEMRGWAPTASLTELRPPAWIP